MSKNRYLVRRLMALVVVAAVVAGAIKAVDALTGGDDPSADADSSAITEVEAEIDAVAEPAVTDGVETADVVAATDATPAPAEETAASSAPESAAATDAPAESDESVVPTAATPAKVLIAGDSDAGTFGPYLVTLLDQTGVVNTTLDYKVSSGLARPDFYDWPAHFRETLPTLDPDIVIVTFGGNDAQGLSNLAGSFLVGQPTGTTPDGAASSETDAEWRAEYGKRVGEVMDLLSADGRTLLWVGIPNDDDPAFTARLAVQNEVVKAEVAERPHVIFIDTWKRFSGRDGNWAEYVIDPRDGQGKDVRSDVDGFHLNENGAEILALDIAEAVRTELRERGAIF